MTIRTARCRALLASSLWAATLYTYFSTSALSLSLAAPTSSSTLLPSFHTCARAGGGGGEEGSRGEVRGGA